MKVALEYSDERNAFFVICEKHGRVPLDDQTQSALEGLNHRQLNQKPGYVITCPTCKQEQKEKIEQEKKMTEIRAVRKRAGVPKRFLRVRVGGWDAKIDQQRKARSIATDYINFFGNGVDDGSSLIFAGPPGTGKTHLAAAILNGIIDKGFTGRYTTGLMLKQAVQNTYQDSAMSRQEVVKGYTDPSLLVLDEVDLMHASEDAQLIIWEVISGRYNEVKPTILISNLNKQQLTDTIGERIIDRMAEQGGKFVAFTWDSHRRKQNV